MRTFLGKINGKIILDMEPLIKLQRDNDFFLMERIIQFRKFKPWEL